MINKYQKIISTIKKYLCLHKKINNRTFCLSFINNHIKIIILQFRQTDFSPLIHIF